MTIKQHISFDLSKYNTFQLMSVAERLVVLEYVEQIPELISILNGDKCVVLGGGSNVILSESVKNLVVLNRIKGISLLRQDDEAFYVEVGAGELWHDWVVASQANGWYGLENLALIPGTVGAAPVQNIGAYGKEVAQFVHEVRAYDLQDGASRDAKYATDGAHMRVFSRDECEFGYRDSVFKRQLGRFIITSVVFRISKKWVPDINYADIQNYHGITCNSTSHDIMQAVVNIRSGKLPDWHVIGNVGSFFMNPVISAEHYERLHLEYYDFKAYTTDNVSYKVAAAWLIEKTGWKGRSLGTPAAVSDKHALVLINNGGASAKDVISLATQIQIDVEKKFNIKLMMEPVIVS